MSCEELLDDHEAMDALSENIREVVKEVMPRLNRNKIYRLKDLYGKKKWAKLSAVERDIADRELLHLLCCDWDILDYVGENHKDWSLYKVPSTYVRPDNYDDF